MKETLYNARGLDETRVRRAFGWVVTFRDFPAESYQTVDGDSMMTDALTFFTKGRAEFYLDGVRRGDRVPGILSSDHDVVGQGGTFELRYVEPTTRVCIPRKINRGRLPAVTKLELQAGQECTLDGLYLVCLGEVSVNRKEFKEESTFSTAKPVACKALSNTLLLQFHDSR